MSYIISIDGPSGSGKSTLVKKLNKILGVKMVDTGMMYRAVAVYFLENNVDMDDNYSVKQALDNIHIKLVEEENNKCLEGKITRAYLNNVDVTHKLRSELISKTSSKVASIKEVRVAMVEEQREYAKTESVVMDGRDIGSVVFPNADVKIFLTADLNTRGQRRYEELMESGEKVTLKQVRENLENRDRENIERECSPLVKTEDMIEIDSTNLSIDEVANKVIDIMKAKGLIK